MSEHYSLAEIRRRGNHPRPRTLRRIAPIAARLAPYVTWALINLGATADQVTYSWAVLGAVSALLISLGSPLPAVAGAALFGLSITLDVVDGQIARVRQTGGRAGRYLDRLFHAIDLPLLAAAMVVASARAGGSPWIIGAGVILVVAVGVSAGQASFSISGVKRDRTPTTDDPSLSRRDWKRLILKTVGSRPMVFGYVAASLVPWAILGVPLADWVLLAYAIQYVAVVAITARRTVDKLRSAQ